MSPCPITLQDNARAAGPSICSIVCMYVYVCMYMYVYVCICMCMYVYVCVCMCMYVWMYVCIYVCVCVYTFYSYCSEDCLVFAQLDWLNVIGVADGHGQDSCSWPFQP